MPALLPTPHCLQPEKANLSLPQVEKKPTTLGSCLHVKDDTGGIEEHVRQCCILRLRRLSGLDMAHMRIDDAPASLTNTAQSIGYLCCSKLELSSSLTCSRNVTRVPCTQDTPLRQKKPIIPLAAKSERRWTKTQQKDQFNFFRESTTCGIVPILNHRFLVLLFRCILFL